MARPPEHIVPFCPWIYPCNESCNIAERVVCGRIKKYLPQLDADFTQQAKEIYARYPGSSLELPPFKDQLANAVKQKNTLRRTSSNQDLFEAGRSLAPGCRATDPDHPRAVGLFGFGKKIA